MLVLRWNSLTFLLNQFAYPFTIYFYTLIKDGDGKLDYEETHAANDVLTAMAIVLKIVAEQCGVDNPLQ